MADFLTAFNRTAKFEGGYQCDPDDNGNWTGGIKGSGTLIGTNYGISAPVLKSYLDREPLINDMKYMPLPVRNNIYKRSYWNQFRGDEINSQDEANALYDAAVNMGVGTAIKLACRAAGLPEVTHMANEIINALNNKA